MTFTKMILIEVYCFEINKQKLNNNNNLFFNTCFTDEFTFNINDTVSKHNCRNWTNENHHFVGKELHIAPLKIKLARILTNQIGGTLFVPGNLMEETYSAMLQNTIIPF